MDFDFQKNIKEMEVDVIKFLKDNYSLLHLDIANPSLIEGLKVNAYGQKQDLKNLAGVSNIDVQTLNIKPWDKSQINLIAKTISATDFGLSVNVLADGIMVNFPSLTEERRKKIEKIAKSQLEDSKKTLRTHRETLLKKINNLGKVDKSISEDKIKEYRNKLDISVKEINNKLDIIFSEKSKQIFKI